jgi:hypothetical protein
MIDLIAGTLFAALLLAPAPAPQAAAEEPVLRQALTGTWQGNGESLELVLDPNTNSIQATEQRDGKVRMQYTCRTDGKECENREEGHKGKVSLWFTPPYLVELRTQGDKVTRRRYLAKSDGVLEVELIPVFPVGKTESVTLSRTTKVAGR